MWTFFPGPKLSTSPRFHCMLSGLPWWVLLEYWPPGSRKCSWPSAIPVPLPRIPCLPLPVAWRIPPSSFCRPLPRLPWSSYLSSLSLEKRRKHFLWWNLVELHSPLTNSGGSSTEGRLVYAGNANLTQNTHLPIIVKSCLQSLMYRGIVECYTDLWTSPTHFKIK